jgi:hypothetical protein
MKLLTILVLCTIACGTSSTSTEPPIDPNTECAQQPDGKLFCITMHSHRVEELARTPGSKCFGLCNPCECTISAGGNPSCDCGESPFADLQCSLDADCGFASFCPAPPNATGLIANAFAFCNQGLHGFETFGQCVTAQVEGHESSCQGGSEP